MSGKSKKAWGDFVTTIKKIGVVWGAISSLGLTGVAAAGYETYQTINQNGKAVQFLVENQIMMKLEFKKSNLEDSITGYKRELRDLRRRFGGVGAPQGTDMDKEDYIEASVGLRESKDKLKEVVKDIVAIEVAELEKLKIKKEGR